MNEVTIEEEEVVDASTNAISEEPEQTNEQDIAVERAVYQDQLDEKRRAVTEDPRNVGLLNELGLVAEKAGDLDRAKWAYKRAIRLEPKNAAAYLNLGRLYHLEDRTKPAIQALQKTIDYSEQAGERDEAMILLQSLFDEEDDQPGELPGEAPGQGVLAEAWQELGLTPAEALMLMDPENSSGRQMMRYTMLDLAIRGVLDVTDRHQVGRGEHFDESKLQPHEEVFAKYFSRFNDYIEVDRLSTAVLSELNSRSDTFKSAYVFQSLVEKGFFEKETQRVWGVVPVSRYVLSAKGLKARKQLKRLLKRTDNQIVGTLKRNPEQAKAYLSEGGPSILLLEEFPASYFQDWQQTLERMGLGPSVERLRDRARQSGQDDTVGTLLKMLLGE